MGDSPAILMRRVGERLYPCSQMDAEAVKAYDATKVVRVKITQPRNVNQHRLYWAAVKLVHDNMDDPPPLDKLHEAIKVRLGYFSTVTFSDGSVAQIADSIAFDKMNQSDFKAYFDAFAKLVHEVIVPGLGSEVLENEARAMLA